MPLPLEPPVLPPLEPPVLVEETHALPFQYWPEPHELPLLEPEDEHDDPLKYWPEAQLDAVSHFSALGIPKSALA